jgi:hypothetical protein
MSEQEYRDERAKAEALPESSGKHRRLWELDEDYRRAHEAQAAAGADGSAGDAGEEAAGVERVAEKPSRPGRAPKR